MSKQVPKYPEYDFVQFIGLNTLQPLQQQEVKDITAAAFEKLKRDINTLHTMIVHIKEYQQDGNRQKYSLHVRLNSTARVFESCKAHDWDLRRAVHKAMNDVKQQISRRFKTEGKRSYKYA